MSVIVRKYIKLSVTENTVHYKHMHNKYNKYSKRSGFCLTNINFSLKFVVTRLQIPILYKFSCIVRPWRPPSRNLVCISKWFSTKKELWQDFVTWRIKSIQKQACCAGCRRRPFPMQLHQQANPPIQQNHRNFWPVMRFEFPSRFRIS